MASLFNVSVKNETKMRIYSASAQEWGGEEVGILNTSDRMTFRAIPKCYKNYKNAKYFEGGKLSRRRTFEEKNCPKTKFWTLFA